MHEEAIGSAAGARARAGRRAPAAGREAPVPRAAAAAIRAAGRVRDPGRTVRALVRAVVKAPRARGGRAVGVRDESKQWRRVLTPRVVEASLALLAAAGLGLVWLVASAVGLAVSLFSVSLASVAVLLVAEIGSRRRWKTVGR